MTKTKTSKKLRQPKGLEPDMKGSLEHSVGITPLLPPSKREIDPVQQLDEALREYKNNTEQKKVLTSVNDDLKADIIKPQLMARREELEGTGKNASIRSSDEEIMAYISEKPIYDHTSKSFLALKRRIEKLENQMEALKKNEIIDGKATFVRTQITVTVK